MTNVTGYTKENKDPVAHGNAPMVNYLKKAEPQSRQADRALSDRVRAMLDDIEQNRDEAVHRYARDLDRWERPEFRVSDAEIAAARKPKSATASRWARRSSRSKPSAATSPVASIRSFPQPS